MADFSVPRHFRNVNEALKAGFEFDECAEVHQARNISRHALARNITLGRGLPRLGL